MGGYGGYGHGKFGGYGHGYGRHGHKYGGYGGYGHKFGGYGHGYGHGYGLGFGYGRPYGLGYGLPYGQPVYAQPAQPTAAPQPAATAQPTHTCTPANPPATPDRGQQTLVTQYPLPYSIPQSRGAQPSYNTQPAYQPVGNQPQQPYTGASYNNLPIYE